MQSNTGLMQIHLLLLGDRQLLYVLKVRHLNNIRYHTIFHVNDNIFSK